MRLLTSLMLAALLGLGTAACGSDSNGDGGSTKTDAGSTDTGGGTGTDTTTTDNGGTPEDDTGGTTGDDVAGEDDTGGTTGDDVGGTEDTAGGDDTTSTDDTSGTDDTGAPACDIPTDFEAGGSHVVQLVVIEDKSQYACDSNNDGTVNDTDGNLNAILTGPLIKGFADVNKSLDESIKDKSLIFLGELKGYSGQDATGLTTNLYSGAKDDKQPDPTCDDITGDAMCDWYISTKSFNDKCEPLVTLPDAEVAGGKLEAGPNDFEFTFVFSGTPLNLKVQHGRILATVADTWSGTDGRICGTVMKDDLVGAFGAACAGANPPSFCQFKDLIGPLINCGPSNECNIVLSFESKPAKSLALEPQE